MRGLEPPRLAALEPKSRVYSLGYHMKLSVPHRCWFDLVLLWARHIWQHL